MLRNAQRIHRKHQTTTRKLHFQQITTKNQPIPQKPRPQTPRKRRTRNKKLQQPQVQNSQKRHHNVRLQTQQRMLLATKIQIRKCPQIPLRMEKKRNDTLLHRTTRNERHNPRRRPIHRRKQNRTRKTNNRKRKPNKHTPRTTKKPRRKNGRNAQNTTNTRNRKTTTTTHNNIRANIKNKENHKKHMELSEEKLMQEKQRLLNQYNSQTIDEVLDLLKEKLKNT